MLFKVPPNIAGIAVGATTYSASNGVVTVPDGIMSAAQIQDLHPLGVHLLATTTPQVIYAGGGATGGTGSSSGLPTGTGSAPSGATTIAAPNTYQTLFSAGSIGKGAYIQNLSTNSVSLFVDWSGATGGALSAQAQEVTPGSTLLAAFLPTNAVTVFAASTISFVAGKF